jgi:hypothetical protein
MRASGFLRGIKVSPADPIELQLDTRNKIAAAYRGA